MATCSRPCVMATANRTASKSNTLADLPALIDTYGLPQNWNSDGKNGPDRYIEGQIWGDAPLAAYRESVSQ